MNICSILEDQNTENRISITPEIAKKYISLGLKVCLPENYGVHLGFKDNEFKDAGVEISKDENEILKKSDIIIQMGLLSDEKLSLIKENQTIVGVLNPYNNKDKIQKLSKKKLMFFL